MTRLRPSTESDVSAIANTEPLARPSGWKASAMSGSLKPPSDRSWVCGANEHLAGHILSRVIGDEAEVLTIAVRPSHRRQGIDNELLQTCTSNWDQEGVRRGFLEVHASNKGARALYTAAGWQETGKPLRYYREGETAIIMRWEQ